MSHDTSYIRIRRGPMGGDHYTQIHNGVFRDRNLTGNAAKIFGWLSTHTQGWATSVTGIAEATGIGRDATRAALSLLKQRHYLVHGRYRAVNGTLGAGWYFLTDLPAQLAEAGVTEDAVVELAINEALEHWKQENTRSEPGWQNPYPGDSEEFPQVGTRMAKTRYLVKPTQAEPTPKKTKEPQENQGLERSNPEHSAVAPSPRSGDEPSPAPKDHHDDNPAPPVQTGVQPQPPRRLDDQEQKPTLHEQFPWPGSWEDQRVERLTDYIAGEVGGLEPLEGNAVLSMVECGVPTMIRFTVPAAVTASHRMIRIVSLVFSVMVSSVGGVASSRRGLL